jgi:hypothetical protein
MSVTNSQPTHMEASSSGEPQSPTIQQPHQHNTRKRRASRPPDGPPSKKAKEADAAARADTKQRNVVKEGKREAKAKAAVAAKACIAPEQDVTKCSEVQEAISTLVGNSAQAAAHLLTPAASSAAAASSSPPSSPSPPARSPSTVWKRLDTHVVWAYAGAVSPEFRQKYSLHSTREDLMAGIRYLSIPPPASRAIAELAYSIRLGSSAPPSPSESLAPTPASSREGSANSSRSSSPARKDLSSPPAPSPLSPSSISSSSSASLASGPPSELVTCLVCWLPDRPRNAFCLCGANPLYALDHQANLSRVKLIEALRSPPGSGSHSSAGTSTSHTAPLSAGASVQDRFMAQLTKKVAEIEATNPVAVDTTPITPEWIRAKLARVIDAIQYSQPGRHPLAGPLIRSGLLEDLHSMLPRKKEEEKAIADAASGTVKMTIAGLTVSNGEVLAPEFRSSDELFRCIIMVLMPQLFVTQPKLLVEYLVLGYQVLQLETKIGWLRAKQYLYSRLKQTTRDGTEFTVLNTELLPDHWNRDERRQPAPAASSAAAGSGARHPRERRTAPRSTVPSMSAATTVPRPAFAQPDGTVSKTCRAWNTTGNCTYGATCRHPHTCWWADCQSPTHYGSMCPTNKPSRTVTKKSPARMED